MFPKRKATALPHYDYAQPSAYFITICTQDRLPILANISAEGQAIPSPFGEIAVCQWFDLLRCYPILDPFAQKHFVVMPDHIHGILRITTGGAHPRVASLAPSGQFTSSPSPTLHQILGAYKSITTVQINQLRGTPGQKVWQRSVYEHIIRNQQDFDEAAQYIAANPVRWAQASPSSAL